jgi:hypothetical protein
MNGAEVDEVIERVEKALAEEFARRADWVDESAGCAYAAPLSSALANSAKR